MAIKTRKKHDAENEVSQPRSLWKGAISFGLVNIPVLVISSREQAELHFTMLDPSNLSPIGYKYYNKTTGEEISRAKTVKAYKYKPDRYVIMTDADFKRANPKATQTIDIENFVELDEIDPVFFEKAHYLLPGKSGDKAYALLRQALLKSHKVAIAKMVLHTKQHLVAVIPRGDYLLLELLHFAEDVKELKDLEQRDSEFKASARSGREVSMAEQLIEDMTSRWVPSDYKNTYRADLMKYVKARVKAGKATEINDDYAEADEKTSSEVIDLLPLLRKSLSRAKDKPRARKRA